jgi:hypothetical protein
LHEEIGGAEAKRPDQCAVGELAEAGESAEQLVLEAEEDLGHEGGSRGGDDEGGHGVDLPKGGEGESGRRGEGGG